MNDLPQQIRQILRPLLPERAFLRRARAGGAFITNAPIWTEAPLTDVLSRAGFDCTPQGGCLLISPNAEFFTAWEREHPDPPDFLCETLLRFRGRPPCGEALALFAHGIRLLESASPRDVRMYDRQVRRFAALCLRSPRGGAYGCALLLHHCQP